MIHSGGMTKQIALAAIGTVFFLSAPFDRAQAETVTIQCDSNRGEWQSGTPPYYKNGYFAGYLVFTNTSSHTILQGQRIYYRFQTATGYGPQLGTVAKTNIKHAIPPNPAGTQILPLKGAGIPCKAYYTYMG